MKQKYNYLISFNFKNGDGSGFGHYRMNCKKKIKLDDISNIVDEINKNLFDKDTSIVILNIIKL